MFPDEIKWQRMQFRKNKVWVALNPEGSPLIQGGKVLIKYQLEQPHEYWVFAKAVSALADPVDQIKTAVRKASSNPQSSAKPTAPKSTEAEIDYQQCICLYTDGASSGNPGPSGIGILLRYRSHEKKISRYIGLATNNIAELEAIRVGLGEVKNRSLPVRVFTDSSYALGLLSKGWKPKMNQELVHQIKMLMENFKDLHFIKVKGHAGHPENECADQLATAAIDDHTST